MKLSVVVPTLKSRDELKVTESLEACPFDEYELLVQDEEPVTRARNAGIGRAQSARIVFLDDDSRVQEGFLERAAETLEEEMAFAGRTIHPKNDIFARQFTGHYSFGDEPRYVDRFWGCNMGVRKEVFDVVGGWDDEIGWGHEEKELAVRVSREFDIYYDPELVVYHPYADSLVDFWKKHYKLGLKTPHYWDRRELSRAERTRRFVSTVADPFNYLGSTPKAALARSGRTVMKSVGRLMGVLRLRQ